MIWSEPIYSLELFFLVDIKLLFMYKQCWYLLVCEYNISLVSSFVDAIAKLFLSRINDLCCFFWLQMNYAIYTCRSLFVLSMILTIIVKYNCLCIYQIAFVLCCLVLIGVNHLESQNGRWGSLTKCALLIIQYFIEIFV